MASLAMVVQVVLLLSLILAPFCIILVFRSIKHKPLRRQSAIVLVLGDVGRSPRMMYHAQSLAAHNWETAIVGYGDTTPIPSLLELPHVHLHYLSNPPFPLILLPWIARAPIRVLWQTWSTLRICLWDLPVHPEFLLVQNPPSIPTLLLAQLISWVGGAKLVIDWHNTGYSILALRVGEASPLCKVAKWFEAKYGQHAYAHLFVTHALQKYLVNEWHLRGKTAVLHDRPPPHFKRTPPMIQHELFHRLALTFSPPIPSSFAPSSKSTDTQFTSPAQSGMPTLTSSRPALVVSSTSWTADEDFSPLLAALDRYQAAISNAQGQSRDQAGRMPKLVVVITGKGALRAPFEAAVSEREGQNAWPDICVRCVFLSAADYPVLLGCADLGISMHSSSSGRDLPMKVVDMFGCGVPVLARGFPAIGELVKDGVNGMVWETSAELGEQMVDVLSGFPDGPQLQHLQSYFTSGSQKSNRRRSLIGDEEAEEDWSSWTDNWDRVMYRGLLAR